MQDPSVVMTTGAIFGRSFKIFFVRLPLLYAIMLVAQLPILALQLTLPDLMMSGVGALMLLLPTVVLQMIATGAMIRIIMQDYLGRPVATVEALQIALHRLGALVGTAILSGLLVFLGSLACLIPGIYFAIVYSLVSQVVIVENLSGMDALNRSKQLVKSDFGRVFGILFLLVICVSVPSALVTVAVSSALPYAQLVVSPGDVLGKTVLTSYPNYAINEVLVLLVQTLTEVFMGICVTLLYFSLRNRNEAFDLQLEADRISAWVEHFRPRAHEGSTHIQPPDVGVVPPSSDVEPHSTGIRPSKPEIPPTDS